MKKVDEKVLNSDLVFLKSLDQPDPASYRAGYVEAFKEILSFISGHDNFSTGLPIKKVKLWLETKIDWECKK